MVQHKFPILYVTNVDRDSTVGIATCYGLDVAGIESRWGARLSSLVYIGPGAHLASYKTGIWSCQWVKRPERGLDHPPTSSAEVKERVELYTFTLHLGLPGLF